MPSLQRGQVDQVNGKIRLRWYTPDGKRHAKQPFTSRSAAWTFFKNEIEPTLSPEKENAKGEILFSDFVSVFLERHAAHVRERTIKTLRERLKVAERDFGNVPLSDLEAMSDEISEWIASQPAGARYGRTGALRQALGAALRWGYITKNPAVLAGKNRQPDPRKVRVFARGELQAISEKLSEAYRPLPHFVAATGMRPEEWMAMEFSDIDETTARVQRTVSSGEVVELGKTTRSRREIPLSPMALKALDELRIRTGDGLLFPSPEGKLLNIDNFRRREWIPAVSAGQISTPARIYDLRSTFASNALAAGISVFELAKIMGTSGTMIERHYGSLLDGAGASISNRLAAFGV